MVGLGRGKCQLEFSVSCWTEGMFEPLSQGTALMEYWSWDKGGDFWVPAQGRNDRWPCKGHALRIRM